MLIKRLAVVLFPVALVLAVLSACAQSAPTPTQAPAPEPTKTLNIGIVTPLTGPAAHLGTNVQNAALLAIEDQNNQGGVTIAGQKYVLNPLVRDSKLDLVVSKSVAEELVFDKGVKVIVGPHLGDAIGVQAVTEPNKIILFSLTILTTAMSGPNKPYSFFYSGPVPQMYNSTAAYIHKFHPNAKTVVTMVPDLPQAAVFLDACHMVCERYGFNWLGVEKIPMGTRDFTPYISRVLPKNPDILDMGATGGAMGGLCAQLIKELREVGDYKGILWLPTAPPPGAIDDIVPEKYRNLMVLNDIDWESPVVSDAYRDTCRRYVQKYNGIPIDIVMQVYNVIKPFFEFINRQDSMDTTVWMEGFAQYHWQGYFGHEAFWVGKPLYGIDRMALRPNWASEYINGKMETKWEPPLSLDLYISK